MADKDGRRIAGADRLRRLVDMAVQVGPGRGFVAQPRKRQRLHFVALARQHLADRVKGPAPVPAARHQNERSEEHTSELQSLMRISYAVFCLKKKNTTHQN